MTVEQDRLVAELSPRASDAEGVALASRAPGTLGSLVATAVVDLKGRMVEVSDRWCTITGWPRPEILGRHWRHFVHADELDETMRQARDSVQVDGIETYEGKIVALDGRVTWLQSDSLPLLVDGTPVGWLIVAVDVTERKLATDELLANRRQLERLLERQQKHNTRLIELDAIKTDLVASVSHELRSPLTSIVSFTHLLRDGLGSDTITDQLEFLEIINRNSERLLRLVDDLLVLDRLESSDLLLDLEPVEPDRLLHAAVSSIRPVADEKGVRVRSELTAGPVLLGDKDRLGQLIDNLLANAVKFTPTGGTVTVIAAPVNGRWRISVTDTGIGIPTDELGALFQRFYRASNAHHESVAGSGLGLAIANRIAELHRGSISVRSQEGQGTTFTVDLEGVQVPGPAGPTLARSAT